MGLRMLFEWPVVCFSLAHDLSPSSASVRTKEPDATGRRPAPSGNRRQRRHSKQSLCTNSYDALLPPHDGKLD